MPPQNVLDRINRYRRLATAVAAGTWRTESAVRDALAVWDDIKEAAPAVWQTIQEKRHWWDVNHGLSQRTDLWRDKTEQSTTPTPSYTETTAYVHSSGNVADAAFGGIPIAGTYGAEFGWEPANEYRPNGKYDVPLVGFPGGHIYDFHYGTSHMIQFHNHFGWRHPYTYTRQIYTPVYSRRRRRKRHGRH